MGTNENRLKADEIDSVAPKATIDVNKDAVVLDTIHASTNETRRILEAHIPKEVGTTNAEGEIPALHKESTSENAKIANEVLTYLMFPESHQKVDLSTTEGYTQANEALQTEIGKVFDHLYQLAIKTALI